MSAAQGKRKEIQKAMKRLYHIKAEIARGAAEFLALLWMAVAVLLWWAAADAAMYGSPMPAWSGAALCAEVILPCAAGAAAALRRIPRGRAARGVRAGVIDAETICRILEAKR